jgi:hypothetical protein
MEEKRKGKKNEKTKRGLVKMTSIVLSSFVISLFNKPLILCPLHFGHPYGNSLR